MAIKKIQKTREEKAVESNFRVDSSDVKYATEKMVKTLPPEKPLEVTEKFVKPVQKEIILQGAIEKPTKRKPGFGRGKREKVESFTVAKKRKSGRVSKKAKEYTQPQVKLKKSGYELIITEKPQAALKIANALAETKPVQKNINKVAYYEL